MPIAATDPSAYYPILLLIVMAGFFGIANVVLSKLLGPRRDGPTKSTPYESGMAPLSSARKRFNVRFFMIALIFLVFDVEVVFLWPWATVFRHTAPQSAVGAEYLARVVFFLLTTIVALVYMKRKGVLDFE